MVWQEPDTFALELWLRFTVYIAIIGKNSYIGKHIADRFIIDNEVVRVDARDDAWKAVDFKGVDVIIHAAAIVHNKALDDWPTYYKANTLLPFEIAKVVWKLCVSSFMDTNCKKAYG